MAEFLFIAPEGWTQLDGFVVPMNQNIMMSETCYVKVQKSGYNIKVVVTQ